MTSRMKYLKEVSRELQELVNVVGPAFGPQGSIVAVKRAGDRGVIASNDGATIVSSLAVSSALTRRVVELSQTVDSLVGDGTTGVILLVSGLVQGGVDVLVKNETLASVSLGTFWSRLTERAIQLLCEEAIDVDELECGRDVMSTGLGSKLMSEEIGVAIREWVAGAIDDGKVIRQRPGSLADLQGVLDEVVSVVDRVRIVGGGHGSWSLAKDCVVEPGLVVATGRRAIEWTEERVELRGEIHVALVAGDLEGAPEEEVNWDASLGEQVLLCVGGRVSMEMESSIGMLRTRGTSVVVLAGVAIGDLNRLSDGLGVVLEDSKDWRGNFALTTGPEVLIDEFDWLWLKKARPVAGSSSNLATIVLRGPRGFLLDEVKRAARDALWVAVVSCLVPWAVAGGGMSEKNVCETVVSEITSQSSEVWQLDALRAWANGFLSIPTQLTVNSSNETRQSADSSSEQHYAGVKDLLLVKALQWSIASQTSYGVLRVHSSVSLDKSI